MKCLLWTTRFCQLRYCLSQRQKPTLQDDVFAGKAHQVGQAERPFTRGIWHMVHDPGKGS